MIDRRVQILDRHRALDRGARTLVGRLAVDESPLHAAAEHQHRPGGREMAVHPVVPRLRHDVGDVDRLVLDLFPDLALGHGVAAELTGQDHQRAIEQPALVEVAHQLRDGRVDDLLHVGGALVAVFVRVPVDERDVFRGDLDVACTGLHQPPRQQAALAESSAVVGVERALRLEREVERLRRRRSQQAIGGIERAHDRLALERASVLVDRLLRQQFLEQLAAALETRIPQLLGWAYCRRRILRVDDQERSVIGPEESRGMKRLQRRDLSRAFNRLSDGDKRRHVGTFRPQRARDHRPDVRHRHRLRRNVAGMPVILMARVQDEPKIRGHERADDGAPVDHAGDVLQPLRELDVVDLGVDRRERAQDVLDRHARCERRVPLRIEGLGARHAARHPQDDHCVCAGLRRRLCRPQQLRLAPDESSESRSGRRTHEAAAAQLLVDQALFFRE